MTTERRRYRIRWVAEQTGIPEPTLRAWERRYGVPEPERTPSGYRSYSVSDVEKVRRMRDLCAGGMSPSDAALAVAEPPEPRPRAVDGGDELRLSDVIAREHVSAGGVVSLSGVLGLMERAAVALASLRLRRAVVPTGCGPVKLRREARLGETVTTVARLESVDEHAAVVEVELTVGSAPEGQESLAFGRIELELEVERSQTEVGAPSEAT